MSEQVDYSKGGKYGRNENTARTQADPHDLSSVCGLDDRNVNILWLPQAEDACHQEQPDQIIRQGSAEEDLREDEGFCSESSKEEV